MPRMTDTEEGFLEGASSFEEAENCDINLNFIDPFPEVVVENRTDEETEICADEETGFSNLSSDFSEEWIAPEDILKTKSKSNPSSALNQTDAALEFFDDDRYAKALQCYEEIEYFEVCDPNMILTNIKAVDSDDSLGGTESKSTSNEKKPYFINFEKSTQTIKSVEKFFTERKSKLSNEVLKRCLNPHAESLDVQSLKLSIVCYKNFVSKSSVSGMNTSKTVIEQSTSSAETPEDQNRVKNLKDLDGIPIYKKVQSVKIFIFLEYITSIVNNLESMNNSLTEIAINLIKSQQTLQKLINTVYEYLVTLKFFPSSVILSDNEYSFGKKKFNVEKFGQGIFEKLKATKKKLNGAFRKFLAIRDYFRSVSRMFCLLPYESTPFYEMQSTLTETAEMYNDMCPGYKKRERIQTTEYDIASEILSELHRVKEFENYLNILNKSQSRERLV